MESPSTMVADWDFESTRSGILRLTLGIKEVGKTVLQTGSMCYSMGVFDNHLYIQYEVVWGPDWEPVAGLTTGTSQMASSGSDPERVVFNMPIDIVFGSTNIFGWPQMIITVRAHNTISGDSLRGYAVVLMPPAPGLRVTTAPLVRPLAATMLGEWLSWLTGRCPELADPKMLASGKENYLLRTESYGSVTVNMSMISKDLRKLGYDNEPPPYRGDVNTG